MKTTFKSLLAITGLLLTFNAQAATYYVKADGTGAGSSWCDAAGLSPLEKATIEKEHAIGIARELANSKIKWGVPDNIFIAGGSGYSGSSAMDMISLKMFNDMINGGK